MKKKCIKDLSSIEANIVSGGENEKCTSIHYGFDLFRDALAVGAGLECIAEGVLMTLKKPE